jgi:hypothetical protein
VNEYLGTWWSHRDLLNSQYLGLGLEVEGSGVVVLKPHAGAHVHLVELAGVGATSGLGVAELVMLLGDGEVVPGDD